MAGAMIPNITKGRWAELVGRVDTDDPTNSVIVAALWRDTSLPADSAWLDYDNFGAFGGSELSVSGYSRKILTQADISLYTVDDTNDRTDWDLADQVWTALAAGQSIQAGVLGYDPDSTGGTDAAILPIHVLTLAAAVATNGQNVTWQFHTSGVNRAA